MIAMTMNDSGLVYTGTWECEGHVVTFVPKENSLITIVELRQSSYNKTKSFSRTVQLEEGIREQDQLIKWGYRRIS